MKTIIFAGILVLSLGLFSNCRSSSVEKKYFGLKGKVASIKDTQYEAIEKFGEAIPEDLESVYKYTFNDKGQHMSTVQYDRDGQESFSSTKEYKDGELHFVKTAMRYSNSPEIITLVSRTSKEEVWDVKNSDGSPGQRHIKFDNSKQNTTITEKDSVGNIKNTILEVSDPRGNLIEIKVSRPDGKNDFWMKAKYNESDQKIEEQTLAGGYSGGTYTYKYTFPEIDEKGNWITMNTYKDGEIEFITVREIEYIK